jgi:putative NADH-flavin reductase
MKHPLKIALLGATGRVGGAYLQLALTSGHQVTALVRDPQKLTAQDHLNLIKGDATSPEDVARVVAGADVVVSCIGTPKQTDGMERTALAVLAAARDQPKPPKCIFVSSLGCGGSSPLIKLISIMLGGAKTFADYDKADALILKEHAVPHVLVRPTGFADIRPTGTYRTARSGGTFFNRISPDDVARFLFDATTSSDWDGPGAVHLGGAASRAD